MIRKSVYTMELRELYRILSNYLSKENKEGYGIITKVVKVKIVDSKDQRTDDWVEIETEDSISDKR